MSGSIYFVNKTLQSRLPKYQDCQTAKQNQVFQPNIGTKILFINNKNEKTIKFR